jgi:quinol monooxygenase YgiN
MLVVLAEARFDLKDTEQVRAMAQPMIEASRAEPGCGGYDYAFDLLEPDLMRVRELWANEQALKDHFATPHMAAFLKGVARAETRDRHREVLRARTRTEDAERIVSS